MTTEFYVPENPDYTIVDSLRDSLRFALTKGLATYRGNTCGRSSFVDWQGEIMDWHDFGCIEGPGWAANSAGAARELMECGRFFGDEEMFKQGQSLLRHSLEAGFLDWDTGLLRGYRDFRDDRFYLNYLHQQEHDTWLCPGSMAYVGVQLLEAGDICEDEVLATKAGHAAKLMGDWVAARVRLLPSGWLPRRCNPEGFDYGMDAYGGRYDIVHADSGDGIFAVRLYVELTRRGLGDYNANARELLHAYREAGGHFGSINHDTYDHDENVAHSVGFRTLLRAAEHFEDNGLRDFAYERCLGPLEDFELRENHNGVECKGLLWMEKTWSTAYFWENAEAAWAYMEAYEDRGDETFLQKALTILRAVSKHHHGPHGFLTEGCDWNGHLPTHMEIRDGAEKVAIHFDEAQFGDILYTEPLLNNMHIAAPTMHYLRRLARQEQEGGETVWVDREENILLRHPAA